MVLRSVLVAFLLLIVSFWARAQSDDRPPGVPEDHWIAISESAGIVIASTTPVVTRLDPNASAVWGAAPSTRSFRGVLMAKHNGSWIRIEIEAPPPQSQRLDL